MAGTLPRPVLGEPAPDVSLPTANGDRWRSADHLGHPVVLVFHRHIH